MKKRTDECSEDDQSGRDRGQDRAEERSVQKDSATPEPRQITSKVGSRNVVIGLTVDEMQSVDHAIDARYHDGDEGEMPGQQHSKLSERVDRSKASPVVAQSQFPWVHANLKKRLKTARRRNEAETRSERKMGERDTGRFGSSNAL